MPCSSWITTKIKFARCLSRLLGRSTGPHWLLRGSKAAQIEIMASGVLLKCGLLHVGFDSCWLGSTLWHSSAWLCRRNITHISPPNVSCPSQPRRGHVPLQQEVAGWDLPSLCASGGCLTEGTSHLSSAVPLQVQIYNEDCSTLRKPPKYHSRCSPLAVFPKEANIYQFSYTKRNGLFIFPTTAILMHFCLPNCSTAGQLAIQMCSDSKKDRVRWKVHSAGQERTKTGMNPWECSFSKNLLHGTCLLFLSFPIRKRSIN